MAKDERKVTASRRQAVIDETDQKQYWQALQQRLRRKCLDLMLQVLYMTRHKIRKLLDGNFFNPNDTGFRMAYAYRLLTRLFRKMMRYYSYARRHNAVGTPTIHIMIHGKVTRLHVDFCYIWWVLIKMDGAYKQATNRREQEEKIKKLIEQHRQLRFPNKDNANFGPQLPTTAGRRWLGPAGRQWPGLQTDNGRGQRSQDPAFESRGQPDGGQ